MAFDTIETPYGKAERIIGGACTYISIAASYFTRDIQVVAVVGDDFPKSELEYLEGRGVNLDGLQIKTGEKSFFWAGRYHENMNGRDTLETQLNVLGTFEPVLPPHYRHTDYVMLGNLSPEVQMSVLDQFETRPKLVALDTMNFWMDIALDALKAVVARIDVLAINEEEARQLSGEKTVALAAKKILTMGPKYLIIKKGDNGAMLFHGEQIFFCPALPLEIVFDPTGAGDTFAGGFMGFLAATDDISFDNMKRALLHGSALASFCVERFGIAGIKGLSEADVTARVQMFKNMIALA